MSDVPYVVVDTETTGLGHIARPPREDAILQVAFAWRENGIIRTMSQTSRPDARFLADDRASVALRIQGRTLADVAASDASPLVAARTRRLYEALGKPELRAYNVAFDQPFLQAHPWSFVASWGPCIMLQAAEAINGPDGKWPKLVEACRALGIPTGGHRAHDAAGDAVMALLVQERLDEISEQRMKEATP